jgi:adenylate kinase
MSCLCNQKILLVISKQTAIGSEAKKIMDAGGLVSDEIVLRLAVQRHAEVIKASPNARILFDGFPRTLWQAKALEEASIPVTAVLLIDVPFDTIIARLSGRWIHASSGRTYAYDYNPPKKVMYLFVKVIIRVRLAGYLL